jgi:hypothetical protein
MSAPADFEYSARRRRSNGGTVRSAPRPRAYSRADIIDAIRRWEARYAEPPRMIDWEPARARRLGQAWRANRFDDGEWPTVRMVVLQFDTFNDAVRGWADAPHRPAATGREPDRTGSDHGGVSRVGPSLRRRSSDGRLGSSPSAPNWAGMADRSLPPRRLAERALGFHALWLLLTRGGGGRARPTPAEPERERTNGVSMAEQACRCT